MRRFPSHAVRFVEGQWREFGRAHNKSVLAVQLWGELEKAMVRRFHAIPVFCLAVLILASCSNGAASTDKTTNPWRTEIQRMYSRTDSDLVREILRDGTITDAEIEEFQESYNKCLAQYDLSSSYSREDGSESVSDQFSQYTPDQLNEHVDQCRTKTGYYELIPLDQEIHANPNHVSEADSKRKIFDCRKRHGLLDADLSYEEYQKIMEAKPDSSGRDPLLDTPFGKYYEDTESEEAQQWFACETETSE
ncbi:hypothetical protein [Bifidobacterium sp. UBA6881]|uniref:hypothetical protein n=1 Tax=Bifidobacterium sp. UBA6881 TaxID=1946109 RepID=UPI0025BA4E13|nr:hypothetical protein [Bifidobacterium sp. UBA6881]